jgi:diguanylate cyclase (GGDEF)-like protein
VLVIAPAARSRSELAAIAERAGFTAVQAATPAEAIGLLRAKKPEHDDLTRLPSRAHFTARVRQALTREPPGPARCAVFLVDRDDFKLINESLGHREGDEVLREAGWRMRASLRSTDTVARFGGDAFAILCEGVRDDGQVAEIVRRIERAFAQPFVADVRWHMLTASIGGALPGPGQGDAETLIRDAHIALSRAKRGGRGRFEMFQPAMHAGSVRAFDLQQRLRSALDHDQLKLVYQPAVTLADGRLFAFEALLRWRSAGEDVSPEEFIPIARTGGCGGL